MEEFGEADKCGVATYNYNLGISMILTQSKFAAYCGVSRVAINKLLKKGALVARPDRKLDTENIINQDYILKHRKEPPPFDSAQPQKPKKNKKSKINKKTKAPNYIPMEAMPPEDGNSNPGSSRDLYKEILEKSVLETHKVLAQVRQLQVKTAKERGELIDRELIKKVFAKLYMIDTGELKTFGAKVSPEIASILGVSGNDDILKVKECIDSKMHTILKHVQRVYADALKEMEKNICHQ